MIWVHRGLTFVGLAVVSSWVGYAIGRVFVGAYISRQAQSVLRQSR